MAYAHVRDIDVDRIPVIDIGGLFDGSGDYDAVGMELQKAARSIGFFYVAGHCIDDDLMGRSFDCAARFFSLDQASKDEVLMRDYHRGLLQAGGSKMEGQAKVDLKESFLWGVDHAPDNADFLAGNELLPPNRWSSFVPGMRETLNDYLDAAHRCGLELLRAIAVSLGVERDYFIGRFQKPISRGSLIHYPPQPADMGEDQYGVSPHTDYGTLTILAQDETGGLRVQELAGEWLTAHPIPGTLVINVGDLLARWSNDRFRSTPHSVVNTANRDRYSIAIAMDPDFDTLVSPVVREFELPIYDDVLCGEYIRGRFDRSFAYRKKLESA